MRYITLSADYGQPSLIDEASGSVTPSDLGVTPAIEPGAAEAWNEEYEAIIPLGPSERGEVATEIRRLDETGLELAERIRVARRDDAKVEYYSEGLLQRLP